MRILIFICVLVSLKSSAQDKLYFLNGTIETGIVSSVAAKVVYFKKTDTSSVRQINKADLILIEKNDGTRYFFSKRKLTMSLFRMQEL